MRPITISNGRIVLVDLATQLDSACQTVFSLTYVIGNVHNRNDSSHRLSRDHIGEIPLVDFHINSESFAEG